MKQRGAWHACAARMQRQGVTDGQPGVGRRRAGRQIEEIEHARESER